MDLSAEITYPTESTVDAFALVVDAEFRAGVCEALDAIDYDVSVEAHDDGGASVTINREMPADVPEAIKKVVGESVKLVQTERWSAPDPAGQRNARLDIKILGQPATMTGTISLSVDGATVISHIRGDVKVAIPFFGKKVEPVIAKAILAGIRAEQQAVTARLG